MHEQRSARSSCPGLRPSPNSRVVRREVVTMRELGLADIPYRELWYIANHTTFQYCSRRKNMIHRGPWLTLLAKSRIAYIRRASP